MATYKKFFSLIISLFFTQNLIFGQPKVVHNSAKGLWEGDPSKQVTLTYLFTLGIEEGNENQELFNPTAVVVNESGDIFILERGNNRVQKFDKDGRFLLTIARKGQGPGELLDPYDMTIDKNGNLYISDWGNTRIQVFSGAGQFLYGFNVPIKPSESEVDSKGFIYVEMASLLGMGMNLLFKFDRKGHLITSFVKTLKDRDNFIMTAKNHISTCIDKNDHIYVAYQFDYKVAKYDTMGNLLLEFDRKLPYPIPAITVTRKGSSVGVRTPLTINSIACDDQGLIYVLLGGKNGEYMREDGNLIIDVFNTEGQYLTKIALGRSLINEIYLDSNRNLYLIDSWNHMQVHKYALKIKDK